MKQIRKILVPIDFSEMSGKNIQLARFMAEKFQAELLVVFVVEDVFSYSGFTMVDVVDVPFVQLDENILENSEKRLASFVESTLAGSAVPVHSEVLQGRVADEIIKYGETKDVDLIVIGTHGHRGLEKMFLGSVTDRVLKLAPCPILTTR